MVQAGSIFDSFDISPDWVPPVGLFRTALVGTISRHLSGGTRMDGPFISSEADISSSIMAKRIQPQLKHVYPLISPKERLAIWEKARGLWKRRKPDPARELKKMRQEWTGRPD